MSGEQNTGDSAKNVFQKIADELMTQAKASGDALVQGANLVVDSVSASGKFLWDSLSEGAQFVLQAVEQTGEIVVDQVTGTVGFVKDGVLFIGGKAVEGTVMIKDGVVMVGETVVGSVINTTRFLGDAEYRETVGIPWLKNVVETNRETLVYQMQQNQKAMGILYRISLGETVSEEETAEAMSQIAVMARLVPALALFLAPGGSLLLPILSKLLPWELVPNLRPPTEETDVASSEGSEAPSATATESAANEGTNEG